MINGKDMIAIVGKKDGYAAKYSDLVTHSYHPVKNITSGEGGAVLTKNKFLFSSVYRNRNHGIIRDKNLMKNDKSYLLFLLTLFLEILH